MSEIYIYSGIAIASIGLILLLVDALTINKRREKRKAEIEEDYR